MWSADEFKVDSLGPVCVCVQPISHVTGTKSETIITRRGLGQGSVEVRVKQVVVMVKELGLGQHNVL